MSHANYRNIFLKKDHLRRIWGRYRRRNTLYPYDQDRISIIYPSYGKLEYPPLLLSPFCEGSHTRCRVKIPSRKRRELTLGDAMMMNRLWWKHSWMPKARNQGRNVTWNNLYFSYSELFFHDCQSEKNEYRKYSLRDKITEFWLQAK